MEACEEGLLACVFFFFFTLVTGPRRSLSLKLSDTRVYEPQIRARLGTTAHFCRVAWYREMEACLLACVVQIEVRVPLLSIYSTNLYQMLFYND